MASDKARKGIMKRVNDMRGLRWVGWMPWITRPDYYGPFTKGPCTRFVAAFKSDIRSEMQDHIGDDEYVIVPVYALAPKKRGEAGMSANREAGKGEKNG